MSSVSRAEPGPRMPVQPTGGAFAALGAIVGPAMMLAIALQKPGPVKTLLRAGALSPETARKIATLGLAAAPLAPLIRAGVVVEEADGRVWLDAGKARRRQWRIGALIGGALLAALLLVAAVMRLERSGGAADGPTGTRPTPRAGS